MVIDIKLHTQKFGSGLLSNERDSLPSQNGESEASNTFHTPQDQHRTTTPFHQHSLFADYVFDFKDPSSTVWEQVARVIAIPAVIVGGTVAAFSNVNCDGDATPNSPNTICQDEHHQSCATDADCAENCGNAPLVMQCLGGSCLYPEETRTPPPPTPPPEICDGQDNDGDGVTDGMEFWSPDGCLPGAKQLQKCVDGQWQTASACVEDFCETEGEQKQESCSSNIGECHHGVWTFDCLDHHYVPDGNGCVGGVLTSKEVCDGLDNNCDGQTDEVLGQTACGVGECEHTVNNCVNGAVNFCNPMEGSYPELCDSLDNNCDGQTDEGLGQATCGVGMCQMTVNNCVNGALQVCNQLPPWPETCDGADNDCDGQTDEVEDLNLVPFVTCGAGACQHDVFQTCVDGISQIHSCNPFEGAEPETCNG
ncbi:MAG: MopE-related protein, partial [Deltaproteobacteria bacterium]|nr:MopE-related protein [Deltaproteobacteria bacterium]